MSYFNINLFQFKLEDLELDYHAKDKIVRLLGQCFDKETGEVTPVASVWVDHPNHVHPQVAGSGMASRYGG